MSQTTLAYRVRRSRPQTSKTEQVRSYPKRERKPTPPVVSFAAVPLDKDDPVLKPLGEVKSKENVGAKQRSKQSEGGEKTKISCEKSPGKRLCIEPPGN